MNYPTLFSPLLIGNLTLRNRLIMAAMSSSLADANGRVSDVQAAYFRERARGGMGLITVEFTCVDRSFGLSEPRQLVLDEPDAIESHRKLVDIVKAEGAAIALQLQLPGQYASPRWNGGAMPVAPSEVISRRDGSVTARALTESEIERIIGKFGTSAGYAMEAGYDAIELHGAHGYLLMAFMTPAMNRRNDAWGGDEERRLRLPLAVIRSVKRQIGDKPLIYRLSADEFIDGGLTIDDMERIVPQLVAAGVDVIHVSTGTQAGTLERIIDPMSMPEGWRVQYARRLRAAAGVPVIVVGMRWPDTAEAALAAGDADLISLGRPMLADPHWARKAQEGRVHDIRPCTSCNWCMDRVYAHQPIACAENPLTGRELLSTLPSNFGAGRKIVVVGAGPGGMAAALQAEAAGYETVLYEARGELGGGLIASAAPPHKEKLLWYRDYLVRRLSSSNVDLRLSANVDAPEIMALKPALVILATGARPLKLDIPGIDGPMVRSAYDMLMDEAGDLPAGIAIVYGGGETGCETAEYLTARGLETILVTRSKSSDLARAAEPIYRKMLRKRLSANPKLTILEETTIERIDESSVVVVSADTRKTIPASIVVIAQGRQSGSALYDALTACDVPVAAIGDVRQIGRIGDAVHNAQAAVASMSKTGAEPVPA